MKPPGLRALALVAYCIVLSSTALDAGETEGGCILYGHGWAVSLGAPPGWTLSCRDPDTNGVEVALWPVASTWKDSAAVMYVNSAVAVGGESLQEFVDRAVARFKEQEPGVVVTEGRSVRTADGKPGMVRYFTGDKWNNHEMVVYVDAGAARLIFVLSSRSRQAFTRYQGTLASLITTAHVMKAIIGSD
jgi:hypothetical protein